MSAIHVLVIPAEPYPSDHSFLEEVHTRSASPVRRTFLMKASDSPIPHPTRWNEATLRTFSQRPRSSLLATFTVYFFDPRYIPHMLRIVRDDRPDAVFIRDLTFPLFIALLLRPALRWQVIFQRSFPHETSWFDPARVRQYRLPWLFLSARKLEWTLLRFLIRRADAVIPISALMADEILAEGMVRRGSVHPFGMGVTRDALNTDPPPRRQRGERLKLVYVGTLAAARGLDRMIEAIRISRFQHGLDVTLTIVGGTGSQSDDLRACALAQGVEKHIQFLGRVSRNRLYATMAEHHAGAIFIARDPRYRVASTTKLLESLVLGQPCVATDAVAMHSELASQYRSILVTTDSAEDYAHGIVQLDARWEELSELATSQRAAIYEEFSYESARIRMERLIVELTAQSE